MKNLVSYKILISFGLLWLSYSCEKADQATYVNVATNEQLTNRGDGPCENCDTDNCCCGFELFSPMDATTFRVCGFDDATTNCSPTPPSGCGTISGGYIQQLLDNSNPKFGFCMLQGNCFQITNMTFGSTGQIKISCDYDQTPPNFTLVTIPFGQTFTWCVDGSCGFELCDHDLLNIGWGSYGLSCLTKYLNIYFQYS